jgi:hypothetical protein
MHIFFVIIGRPGIQEMHKKASKFALLFLSPKPSLRITSLHLLFTTMLYKSLVSFIVAFTVAAGVASATPVARTDGSASNTGTQSCCNTVSNANDPIVTALQGLAGIAIPVDLGVPIGISCLNALGTSSW